MLTTGEDRPDDGTCAYALRAAEATADATAPTGQRRRSWAGLTSRETILVSVERLLGGQDVDYLVSHETVHHVLLHASMLGMAQLTLEALSHPLSTAGVVSVRSRQCLAILFAASTNLHEICATVWPQVGSDAERRERYWADLPATYRVRAQPVATWFDGIDLPVDLQRSLLSALGEFALGCAPPVAALTDPSALRAFLDDAAHDPERRFELARAELAGMSGDELATIARAESPPAALAAALNGKLGAAAGEFTATPRAFGDWYEQWRSMFWDVVSIWRGDPRLSDAERSELPASRQDAMLVLQSPSSAPLQTLLTQTSSASARAIHDPQVDDLLPYPLCLITWNGLGSPFIGFEQVDGAQEMVGPDQAALWLYAPDTPLTCAVVDRASLTDYLTRVPDDRTVCVADAFYWFPKADVIAPEPILRERRHLVVLRHRPLGSLLNDPMLGLGLAHETRLEYTTWQGSVPAISYFLCRPAQARTPIIVAPVPAPTAAYALRQLETGTSNGIEWVRVPPERFMYGAGPIAVDLIRFCAWFEDKPWPDSLLAASQPQQPPVPPADPWHLGPPPIGAQGGDTFARLPASTQAKLGVPGDLEARGRLRRAARGYRKLMRSDTLADRAAAAIALGFLHARASRLDECVAAWREAAESGHPDLAPYAWLQLGGLFHGAHEWQTAAAAFLAAARSGSAEHAPPAALRLAELLDRLGEAAPARQLLQWVVDSGHPDVAPIAAERLRSGSGHTG